MSEHWEVVNSGKIQVHTTAQGLWANAAAYFKWCDENPIEVPILIRSGSKAGQTINEKRKRPYSIQAVCLHCGISEYYLRDVRNSKDKTNEYYIVINKILHVIFIQNLEGAMVGEFNPIFTAKLLNMEKDDTPTGGVRVEVVTGLPELSESENQILEKLESEISKMENDDSKNASGSI